MTRHLECAANESEPRVQPLVGRAARGAGERRAEWGADEFFPHLLKPHGRAAEENASRRDV